MRYLRPFVLALAVAFVLVAPAAEAALALQGLGAPARVTVATTVGTLTLPDSTEYIRFKPITISANVEIGCTDGAALGTHYITIAADTAEVIHVHPQIKQGQTICLAGSGAGTVEVMPMVRGR